MQKIGRILKSIYLSKISNVSREVKPTLEPEMMKSPDVNGISVAINHCRAACFTTAIPINPNDQDFPKLCIAAQLFSMAQKWVSLFLAVNSII